MLILGCFAADVSDVVDVVADVPVNVVFLFMLLLEQLLLIMCCFVADVVGVVLLLLPMFFCCCCFCWNCSYTGTNFTKSSYLFGNIVMCPY